MIVHWICPWVSYKGKREKFRTFSVFLFEQKKIGQFIGTIILLPGFMNSLNADCGQAKNSALNISLTDHGDTLFIQHFSLWSQSSEIQWGIFIGELSYSDSIKSELKFKTSDYLSQKPIPSLAQLVSKDVSQKSSPPCRYMLLSKSRSGVYRSTPLNLGKACDLHRIPGHAIPS